MIELTPERFLTDAVMALVVVLLVEAVKRWYVRRENEWYYEGMVIVTAFVVALIVNLLAYYGNRLEIDGHVAAILTLRSVVIGAMASGGYEWVTNMWRFARGAIDTARVNVENAGGDVTVIGNMHDVHGAAVGDDADAHDGSGGR